MINYKTKDGKVELQLGETGLDITAETLLMIKTIYDAFNENGGKATAKIFKESLEKFLPTCFTGELTKKMVEEKASEPEPEEESDDDDDLDKQLDTLCDLLVKLEDILKDADDKHLKS